MKKVVYVLMVCALLIVPETAKADKTDKLIQLLIKKNIVTVDEARVILEELEDEEKVEPAKKLADWTEKIEVKYAKGAVIKTADNKYSIKLNARFHGLFTYENPDSGSSSSTFRNRRSRILASGNVFFPWLKYGTQVTLEGGSAGMRDAYMEAAYFNWMIPRFGQYKVPFDREFLDGGFNLQLIDRSIASSEFSLQRDVGLQVSGKKILNSLEYNIGIFNGSGANQNNVDNDYMYIGRLVWAPFGSYPYSESAVDNPSSPVFAVGIAGAYMPGLDPGERKSLAGILKSTTVMPVESDVTQWTADLAYKYRNLSMMSGYYYRNIEPNGSTIYGEQDAWGVYLQGGYFIVPKKFEVAGRYSLVDGDNPSQVSDNREREVTLGVSYYLKGHSVKTGLNYSLFSTEKSTGDEDEHVLKASVIVQF